MPTYTVRYFEQEIELDDEEEIAGVNMSVAGSEESRAARNIALVRVPENEEYVCGHPTDGGECQRSVNNSEEYCWMHEDE